MPFKSLILVVLQFTAMFYLIIEGPLFFFNFWLLCYAFGIFIALWGIFSVGLFNFNIQPEVKSNTLIQDGVYRWIRNPMYSGILIFFIPVTIQEVSLIKTFFYGLLLLVFILKVHREEFFLLEKFGEEYRRYKAKTSRFIPYII